MELEELLLSFEGAREGLVPSDVLLGSIDHPNNPEPRGVNLSRKNLEGITDANTLWVAIQSWLH